MIAPAIHAEMDRIIIFSFVPANTATTIGIKIPKVPQEVPVANARIGTLVGIKMVLGDR